MLSAGRLSILFVSVVLLFTGCASSPTDVPQKAGVASKTDHPATPSPSVKPPVFITVAAVGDMMLGTDFPRNHLPPDEGRNMLASVHSALQAADITFGNLEGTLMDGGEPEKECLRADRCYLFRSPSHYAWLFQQAGFDVVSLANNHARDFGEAGRSSSMRALDRAGIRHSGLAGDVASWEVKGRRVAMIAFAPFKNSHDMLDIPAAKQQIAELAVEHDIVLVSMHAGAEGMEATRIPFTTEYYYGEDRGNVVAFAHAAIDAGADLVLGHGPHVPRALELYQGRLIAYSLGNFSTYYGISVAETKGLAPILKVTLDSDGGFVEGRIISAQQIRPHGPKLDAEHRAAKLIKNLTEADFPATPLKIEDDGRLRVVKSGLQQATAGEAWKMTADKQAADR